MSNDKDILRIDNSSIWGTQDILDTDHEKIEYDLNFPDNMTHHPALSINDYLLDQQENMFAAADDSDEDEICENNISDDSQSYHDEYQDGMYYLI